MNNRVWYSSFVIVSENTDFQYFALAITLTFFSYPLKSWHIVVKVSSGYWSYICWLILSGYSDVYNAIYKVQEPLLVPHCLIILTFGFLDQFLNGVSSHHETCNLISRVKHVYIQVYTYTYLKQVLYIQHSNKSMSYSSGLNKVCLGFFFQT